MWCFFIFITFGIVLITIVYTVSRQSRTDETWRETARELDLRFSYGSTFLSGLLSERSMTGTYEGYRVRMWTYSDNRNSNQYFTAARVQLSEIPFSFQLSSKGFLQSIGTFLGGQDIKIGNESFDNEIIVKGRNQQQIRSFLTQERMTKFIRLFRSYPHSEITDTKIELVQEGVVRNQSQLKSMLDQAIRTARLLEGEQTDQERKADDELHQGMREQNNGNIPEARKQYDKSLDADPENVDALTHKASAEFIEENYNEAASLYEEALRQEPNDPMLRAHYQRTARKAGIPSDEIQAVISEHVGDQKSEPDPAEHPAVDTSSSDDYDPANQPPSDATPADQPEEPEPSSAADTTPQETEAPPSSSDFETQPDKAKPADIPEVSSPGEPQPPEQPDGDAEPSSSNQSTPDKETVLTDKTTVIQELFDPRTTSVDAGNRFEETYKGKEVSWSGKFQEAKTLSLSMKFGGDREGGLIKVLLHSGKQGTEVKRDCYAFVHLPDGEPEGLEEGDDVQFRGTLFQLDEFMRNLYIADATIKPEATRRT